jgi:hypothetical protein
VTTVISRGLIVRITFVQGHELVDGDCVIAGESGSVIEFRNLTMTQIPAVDTIVDITVGPRAFRATVQRTEHATFVVLRPLGMERFIELGPGVTMPAEWTG